MSDEKQIRELVPKDSIVSALKGIIPDAEWVLRQIESDNGYLRTPPLLANIVQNLNIGLYPRLYENEAVLMTWYLRVQLTEEEIREFCTEIDDASLQERGEFLEEICKLGEQFVGQIELPKTKEDEQRLLEEFEALNEEEKKEAVRQAQILWGSFFAYLGQHFSMMVHGEKLTSLVAQAKAGNDDAFVKAVQIDTRILSAIPYFSERLSRARLAGDQDFCDKLAYRMKCAPYKGKIRHKSLWLAFSFLEQAGLLDSLPHPEILELCDEVGVGGKQNRVATVGFLSKRIAEYRKFQRRGIASTP